MARMLERVARSSSPLKLKVLPAIADRLPAHAGAFGITLSALTSILVWNDGVRPNRALRAITHDRRLSRVPVNVSLRAPQMKTARSRARAQRLSLNAYLEALLAAQLGAVRRELIIYPAPK